MECVPLYHQCARVERPGYNKLKHVFIGVGRTRVRADLDTGASLVFIGHEDAERHCTITGSRLLRLPHPFRVEVANHRFEQCVWYFIDSLEIPSSAGPVCVDNVVFYVMDCEWPELLVGYPVLDHLDMTPERRLHALANTRTALPLEIGSDGAPANPPAASAGVASTSGFVIVNGEENLEDIIAGDPEVARAMKSCPFIPASEFARRREKALRSAVSWSVSEAPTARAYTRTRKHYSLGRLGKLAKRVRLLKRRQISEVVERLERHRASQVVPEWTEHRSICPKVLQAHSAGINAPFELPLENDGAETDFEFDEQGELEEPEVVRDFEFYLQKALADARSAGCTDVARLERIIRRFRKVFAVDFEECSISKLTPMEPKLKPDARPTFAKPRRMSPEQLEWLRSHINKMVKLGMLKETRNPTWGVPVFVVKKPHGKGWRMVADFRALNHRSLPTSLPMPLLEQLIGHTQGAKVYGSFDNMKGFDLLGVTRSDLFTLVTPFGCYEMTVAPMGYLNSPATYQDRIVNEVLKGLHRRTCVNWIDDLLVYAEDDDEYLTRLEEIFARYEQYQVKLAIKKCTFYAKKIKWCGREFTDGSYSFDPELYDKVLSMPEPVLASDLASFLYTLTWLGNSLDPTKVVDPKARLQRFLDRIFKSKSPTSRKGKLLEGVHLSDFGWGETESSAFAKLKDALHHAIRVAVPKKDMQLCLFTDASFEGCSIIVTQVDPAELHKPVLDQRHEIVFVTSHRWTEPQSRWHVSSLEAYPIIFALQRLDWLFLGRHLKIYMDHRNLAYIFNPEQTTPKTTLMRLQRWALIIQAQRYSIEHIPGEVNIAADLFSRWGVAQERTADKAAKRARRNRKPTQFYDPGYEASRPQWRQTQADPAAHGELDRFLESRLRRINREAGNVLSFPSREQIYAAQQLVLKEAPREGVVGTDGLIRVGSCIWIPDSLLPKLVAVAHSLHGHPGAATLTQLLRSAYYNAQLALACRAIGRKCLHCLGEHSPRLLRRRFGQQLHGRQRNAVIHMDFLFIEKRGYMLVMRDDMTGKTEFFPCTRATAHVAASSILWWRARYGLNPDTVFVTDGGSHFANALVRLLVTRLKLQHHFTVAYSPWTNGTAERVNREILKLLRSLMSQDRASNHDWRSYLPSVQFLLNNTPRARLGGRTSDQVFLGSSGTPQLDMLAVDESTPELISIPTDSIAIAQIFDALYAALEDMHSNVADVQAQIRAQAHKKQEERKQVEDIQFEIGDWVLVSRATRKQHKLQLQWIGPYQITDIRNRFVYRVRSVINDQEMDVHAARLQLFSDGDLDFTEDLAADYLRNTKGFTAEKFVSSRWNSQTARYELLCHWWGFDSSSDTWISYHDVERDYPDLLDDYLANATDTSVIRVLKSRR